MSDKPWESGQQKRKSPTTTTLARAPENAGEPYRDHPVGDLVYGWRLDYVDECVERTGLVSDGVSFLPVVGVSSEAATRHNTSTGSANAAHPSSHQKRAIYQRYTSLKMVHAIATAWNVHEMTGKRREDRRAMPRQFLPSMRDKTKRDNAPLTLQSERPGNKFHWR